MREAYLKQVDILRGMANNEALDLYIKTNRPNYEAFLKEVIVYFFGVFSLEVEPTSRLDFLIDRFYTSMVGAYRVVIAHPEWPAPKAAFFLNVGDHLNRKKLAYDSVISFTFKKKDSLGKEDVKILLESLVETLILETEYNNEEEGHISNQGTFRGE